jgi:hypothetical protein
VAYDLNRDHRTLATATDALDVDAQKSDTVDLTPYPEALYIGVTGDVKVDMVNGQTVTFKAHPVGYLLASVRRVYSTGTTATNILGLF